MKITCKKTRVTGKADPMIYGHFLEHHHRQVYGGVFDPSSRFADEDGFREDVIEALRTRGPEGSGRFPPKDKDDAGRPRAPGALFLRFSPARKEKDLTNASFCGTIRKRSCERRTGNGSVSEVRSGPKTEKENGYAFQTVL